MIRTGRLVAGLLVVAFAVLAAGAPAFARTDGVALSRDGVTWTSHLTVPLFDPALRWVPGDRATRSFYVRNDGGTHATLDVSLLGARVDDLLQTHDLSVSVRAGDGPWTSITDPGPQTLVHKIAVAAGHRERISVRVALAASSVNPSQVRALDLRFVVRLTQDRPAASGAPSGNPIAGLLPNTGGPAFAVLLAGLAALATGLVLLLRTRRRVVEQDV